MDTAYFMHFFLHQVQQAYHVIGGRARMRDDKIGISFANLRRADLYSCQSGLIDKTGRLITAWVFEHPNGGLELNGWLALR